MISERSCRSLEALAQVARLAERIFYLNTGPDEEHRVRMSLVCEKMQARGGRIACPVVQSTTDVIGWCARLLRRLEKIRATGVDVVLLLSDRVEFIDHAIDLPALPPNWRIIFLGGMNLKSPTLVRGYPGIVAPKDIHGIGGALVRLSELKRLRFELRALYHRDGWPRWPMNTLSACPGVFACYPNIAWTNDANAPLSTQTGGAPLFDEAGRQLIEPLIETQMASALLSSATSPRDFAIRAPRMFGRTKLGVLFLTIAGLTHDEMWREYFEHGGGRARGWLYARNPGKVVSAFSGSILGQTRAFTEWGHISLVKVMVSLIREALEDEDITHVAFASESCVPIRPVSDVVGILGHDGRSRLVCEPVRDPLMFRDRAPACPLLRRNLMLHSQWVVLTRRHARMIVAHDQTDQFNHAFAPDEAYFGTVLCSLGEHPTRDFAKTEATWKEWPYPGSSHPRLWNNVDAPLIAEIRRSGAFFARKVARTSNIRDFGPHI